MNAVIQSSLSNIAIIFFMHLCITILLNNREKLSRYFAIGIISVVSFAVILLFYLPITYGGYHFDLRLVPLVFLTVKWGWRFALPALVITSAWRLGIGGPGAVPGVVFGMVLPVFYSFLFNKGEQSKLDSITLVYLVVGSWLISDLPIIMMVPDGWNVFKDIMFFRFSFFMLIAFTLNFFISSAEKELDIKEKLQYYARHDPLTGLYNIRFFEEKIASHSASDKKMYIAMVDIDFFKAINDTHGHVNGDKVLKDVAAVISEEAACYPEQKMVAGRYGGEEFILFAMVDKKEEMEKTVESIREKVERRTFYTQNKKHEITLTISIGVCSLPVFSMLHEAINLADHSLYESKKNGRNQIHYTELKERQ
ncbi:hypothetical protein A8F95_14240 [Bacillus wudalianchiensis]|uniref:GGDEF domain-containing protein n=1 Tax=Pseudobacillus wudalianchiensis TaxID=1743143 RepID=A0A1B9AGB8_9BACI|nr:hypothetical protein A8F95_14240 [Bacillus wudalianchiensis]